MNRLYILSILLTILIFPLCSQEKVKLEFDPPKGLEYVTVYDSKNVNVQEVMGVSEQVELNSVTETLTLVEDNDENSSLLKVEYRRLMLETISPNVQFTIDTELDDDQPGIDYVRTLIGKPFYVRIAKNGEILEITGLRKAMDMIISEIDTTEQIFAKFKNTINTFYNEEQIRNNLTLMNPIFPDKTIDEGDSWKYDINSSAGRFQYVAQNTSEVIEVTGDEVILQINSNITTPEDISFDLEGVLALMDLGGNEVAEITIDPETGLSIEGVKKQTINTIMKLDMSDRGREDIEIPMNISTSTNISVKYN